MESRPPQETPRRPVGGGGRKPNGAGGAPTPPWLWLFLIAVVCLIIYFGQARNEQVDYVPWFLNQVKNKNIEKLSIQGTEVHGKLRVEQPYEGPGGKKPIKEFSTYFPSEESIQTVIDELARQDP